MNSKEENSQDFCLDFVQEFGLWILTLKAVVRGYEVPRRLSNENKFLIFCLDPDYPE